MQTYTAEQAGDALAAEGYALADIVAVMDSMVEAGLELDQPDNDTVFTAAELDLLREQLSTPPEPTTPYVGGVAWHTTVLDGKTIRWCSSFGDQAIVQAVIDPASDRPARRVLNDGASEALDEQRGLTVYGRHAGDRPTVERAADLTPEYAYLMAGLAEGRGITVPDDRHPTPLDLREVAELLGISYDTARQYRSAGRLPAPNVMVGRSPRWYAGTIEQFRARRPGQGARTDLQR